jgi:hypothetical protein
MSNEEKQLLGFPEERRSAKSTMGKKGKKSYSDTAKRAPEPTHRDFESTGRNKPMLYENDEGTLSAWDKGNTSIELHMPIAQITADGKVIDPATPGAISDYNLANDVVLRL